MDELTEGRGGGHDGASRQSMKKRKESELIFSRQNHVRLLQNAQNSDDDDGSEKKSAQYPLTTSWTLHAVLVTTTRWHVELTFEKNEPLFFPILSLRQLFPFLRGRDAQVPRGDRELVCPLSALYTDGRRDYQDRQKRIKSVLNTHKRARRKNDKKNSYTTRG